MHLNEISISQFKIVSMFISQVFQKVNIWINKYETRSRSESGVIFQYIHTGRIPNYFRPIRQSVTYDHVFYSIDQLFRERTSVIVHHVCGCYDVIQTMEVENLQFRSFLLCMQKSSNQIFIMQQHVLQCTIESKYDILHCI